MHQVYESRLGSHCGSVFDIAPPTLDSPTTPRWVHAKQCHKQLHVISSPFWINLAKGRLTEPAPSRKKGLPDGQAMKKMGSFKVETPSLVLALRSDLGSGAYCRI